MSVPHVITAVFTGVISLGALVIAIFQFNEKGPVFTNKYLLYSPKEREKFDKKAEYRLAAVVFTTVAVLFAMVTAALLTGWYWLNYAAIAGGVGLVVYVIIQAAKGGDFS